MRVIVNGACGHMGREIVRLAQEGYQGASLAASVDAFSKTEDVLTDLHDAPEADVIIDFSHHSAVRNTSSNGFISEPAEYVVCPSDQQRNSFSSLLADGS